MSYVTLGYVRLGCVRVRVRVRVRISVRVSVSVSVSIYPRCPAASLHVVGFSPVRSG